MAVAQAVRVQRPSWANVRTALGLLLFCGALLAGQRLIVSAQDTAEVWVAARDLPAGTVVSAEDLRAEDVRLPDDLAGRYLAASTVVEGRSLSHPVLAGEMLAGSWLLEAAGENGGRTISISFEGSAQAVSGIGIGDHVDLIATFDPGDVASKTVPVVRGAEVVEVIKTQGLVEGSDVVGIAIAVPDELVGMVAFATNNAEIDIIGVDGGSGSSEDWTVTRKSF
ncbi:MAG: hypothetical protein H0U17_04175 [Actinobacteria bacterium]|nr:hypothetical protein [Actinomycetota bacterium]